MAGRIFRRIAARAAAVDPTVVILLAALAIHVVRRNVFDVVVFGATVLVIAADHYRPAPGRRRRVHVSGWLVAGVAVVFGWRSARCGR